MSICVNKKLFIFSLIALGSIYIPKIIIDTYRIKYKEDVRFDKINSVVTKIYPFLLVISLILVFLAFSRGNTLTERLTSPNGQYILMSTFYVLLALYIKIVIRPDYYYKSIRIHSFISPLFITGSILFNYTIFLQNNDKRTGRLIFTIVSTILIILSEIMNSVEETTATAHIVTTFAYLMICLNNSIL